MSAKSKLAKIQNFCEQNHMPISAIKKLLPTRVKQPVRNLIKFFRYRYRHLKLKQAIGSGGSMKIIVGAAETHQEGWYSTNEQWLDITKDEHWRALFGTQNVLTHVVAEHVFEHLHPHEVEATLANFKRHLKPGGRVRIAVPDGLNPDPIYLKNVGIAGIGADAADHKQLINVDTLSGFLKNAGFEATHVEGYDRNGRLVNAGWRSDDGYILRSRQNGSPNKWGFPDANTSLIVDGVLQ